MEIFKQKKINVLMKQLGIRHASFNIDGVIHDYVYHDDLLFSFSPRKSKKEMMVQLLVGPPSKTERDIRMYHQRQAGGSIEMLAGLHDISVGRVRQILKNIDKKMARSPKFKERVCPTQN